MIRGVIYLTAEWTARHVFPVKSQIHGVRDRFPRCKRNRVSVGTLRLC